ncbi:MAG: hypothetical protein RLT05_33485, partial [Bauldia litoralis]
MISVATALAAVGACSESTSTGSLAGKPLGSKKPIRLSNKGERVGSADPDLALMTGVRPPKDS